MIRLRQENRALRRRRFLHGQRIRGTDVKDIAWFSPLGTEMSEEDWNAETVQALGVRLVDAAEDGSEGERPAPRSTVMLLFNAHHEKVEFTLPPIRRGEHWELLLDTAETLTTRHIYRGGRRYAVGPRSLVVLRLGRR